VLWGLDLPGAAPAAPPRLPVEVGEVVQDAPGPLITAMGPDGRLASGRFTRGCRCFAARSAGELVAYAWVSTGGEWIGEIAAPIRPAAREAYVWNCVTLARYRRLGLYRALVGTVAAALGREGTRRLWLATVSEPPYAGDGVRRTGFRPVLRVTCVRLGAWRVAWAVAEPAAGADLIAGARAALGRRLLVGRHAAILH